MAMNRSRAPRIQARNRRSPPHAIVPAPRGRVRAAPLRGYATLTALFLALCGAFSAWFRTSGCRLPARVDPRDLGLVAVARHKAARVIAKDRVARPLRAAATRWGASKLAIVSTAEVLQIAYDKLANTL
jgi:hypothetical protein